VGRSAGREQGFAHIVCVGFAPARGAARMGGIIPVARSDRLSRLGAESSAERAAKRIVPWIASMALHLGLIFTGFLVTWTVVRLGEEGEIRVVVAEFEQVQHEPVTLLEPELREETPTPLELEIQPVDRLLEVLGGEAAIAPPRLMPDVLMPPTDVSFTPSPPETGSASFMGISTPNASRVVYVIDASGTMIAYLQIVLRELARSLDGLTPSQSFGVVFFQENRAIQVPPRNRLIPATPDARSDALRWIREGENIIPRGRSNPVAAFEHAMQLKPDVIFLLSDNITGSGIYEIDQGELLARLEKLNPADRLTGNRRTLINCIQFLDPDPQDTLRRIAEAHGGPRGYKFLSRRELGLSEP
jgi:hypothetical protein